jgi:hypothetical protein
MVSAARTTLFHRAAFVALFLYDSLSVLIGLFSTFAPLVLRPRGPFHVLQYILVGPIAALVGAGTLVRLRLAAVLLSLLYAVIGVEQMYGIAHGFGLPNPPHISAAEIIFMLFFTFLPVALTIFAWPQLQGLTKPSNQSLQPTAGRSDE